MVGDGPEEIARCLECTKSRCSNCLAHVPHRMDAKKARPVVKIDATTGELVAYYPTVTKASKENKISPGNIAKHCESGVPYKGFIWKNYTEEGDNTQCSISHKSKNE